MVVKYQASSNNNKHTNENFYSTKSKVEQCTEYMPFKKNLKNKQVM